MAGIKQAFIDGVNTIFEVMHEAVDNGVYTAITDTGFEDPVTVTDDIRVILDNFTQEDIDVLTFSGDIQPTDSKGLIPAVDMAQVMLTGNTVTIGTRIFTVVAFEIDPMKVLYTTLLRDV